MLCFFPLVIFIIFIKPIYSHGQDIECIPAIDTIDGKMVLSQAEQMPEFPGGEEEMYRYLVKSFKYPIINRDDNIQSHANITFIVDTMGQVRRECIFKPFKNGELSFMETEFLKIVSSLPRFSPAKNGNEKVPIRIYPSFRICFK